MIQTIDTVEYCLCLDKDGKRHLFRAPRSNMIYNEESGQWKTSQIYSVIFDITDKGEIRAYDLSIASIIPYLTVLQNFIKEENFELTVEEPITIHMKAILDLTYTIE